MIFAATPGTGLAIYLRGIRGSPASGMNVKVGQVS